MDGSSVKEFVLDTFKDDGELKDHLDACNRREFVESKDIVK